MKGRIFKRIALLATASTLSGLSVFQQFAIAMTQQQQWNQFMGETITAGRGHTQSAVTNIRSQHNQHAQTLPHNQTIIGGGHSHTTQYNQTNLRHSQANAYVAMVGPINTIASYFAHTHNGTQGGFFQRHNNVPAGRHSQSSAHYNRYTQNNIVQTIHTQAVNTHSDTVGHNNVVHSDTGFDHTNFIPLQPAFFDLQPNEQLFGAVTLGVFSYDRNTDGHGSQESISRIVHYDLAIRRIQNLNGTANASAWRALLSNEREFSATGGFNAGGIRFNLNTIDPLGTGNTNAALTEGVYEIRAVARNTQQHGVNFESPVSTIQVRIQQNHIPEIIVQNGSEFINFTFGHTGALSPTSIFSTYQAGLFANATAEQREGILVRFNMRDADTVAQTIQNWQRGRVYLSRADNTEIAGTSVPIVWENGQHIISSENVFRGGLGFIPRSAFTGLGDLVGLRVTIEVQDFRDATATTPTGTTVTQRIISTTNATSLTVNVDVTAPTVTASPANTAWRNTPPAVTLTYADATTSVAQREFLSTASLVLPTSGWLPYTAPVSMNIDGERFLHFRATDALGNIRTGTFGPYRLDRVAPSITIAETILAGNQTRLTATATDALSGIAEIRATGPVGSGGPWVSTTSPLIFTATREGNYTFTISDNAGNIRTITHNVIFVPILHGLSLTHIVRPPAGTVAPISYPVPQPTRVNSGFRMTFRVNAQRASSVELRLFANGVPVNIHTDAGSSQFLTRNTTTLDNTSVEFAFWVDRNIPLNTVLDMRLILRRDGHVITNNDIGRRFAIISGSARQSIGINLTR